MLMEIIGFIAVIFIGISLGLIGAGGSILTVPVMVYLFDVPVLMATSYSLFIVGITSLVGAVQKHKQGNVNYRIAIHFCLVSLIVVYVVRQFVIPAIPHKLFFFQGIAITSALVNMTLFACLMIAAAYSMIRRKHLHQSNSQGHSFAPLFFCSVVVGLVTGLMGAGGGFLLIPALVLLLGLSMKEAIGTSLLIIASNSLIGFSLDINHFSMEWMFLGCVTLITITGLVIGLAIGKKIPARHLKIAFGWFVLFMGVFILLKEFTSLAIKIYNSQLLAGIIKLNSF